MLELRQFDLQFAFAGPRALGKNVENERRPIQNFATKYTLEIAALPG